MTISYGQVYLQNQGGNNQILIVPKVLAGYFDTVLLTHSVARMKRSVIRGFESSVPRIK